MGESPRPLVAFGQLFESTHAHQRGNVKDLLAASLRSAAKLNGELSEKINFWFYSNKRKFFIYLGIKHPSLFYPALDKFKLWVYNLCIELMAVMPKMTRRCSLNKIIVSINGLDKAAVLAVLYNRAITGGMGFMQYDPKPMTVEQAREILHSFERITETKKFLFWRWEIEKRPAEKYIYFDYLGGRSMKVNLTSDEEFDATWYNHPDYNGKGAAEDAIKGLRETEDVNPPATQVAHVSGVLAAAKMTRGQLGEKSKREQDVEIPGLGTISTFHLGLNDMAGVLGPKIDEVKRRLPTKR